MDPAEHVPSPRPLGLRNGTGLIVAEINRDYKTKLSSVRSLPIPVTERGVVVHAGNSYVHGIWRSNGIKPHLTRTFKVSRDPDFVATFWGVVGL